MLKEGYECSYLKKNCVECLFLDSINYMLNDIRNIKLLLLSISAGGCDIHHRGWGSWKDDM